MRAAYSFYFNLFEESCFPGRAPALPLVAPAHRLAATPLPTTWAMLTNLTRDATGVPNLRSGGPLEQDRASLLGYAGIGSQKPWGELKV